MYVWFYIIQIYCEKYDHYQKKFFNKAILFLNFIFVGIDSLGDKFTIYDVFLPIFMAPTKIIGLFLSGTIYIINNYVNTNISTKFDDLVSTIIPVTITAGMIQLPNQCAVFWRLTLLNTQLPCKLLYELSAFLKHGDQKMYYTTTRLPIGRTYIACSC